MCAGVSVRLCVSIRDACACSLVRTMSIGLASAEDRAPVAAPAASFCPSESAPTSA